MAHDILRVLLECHEQGILYADVKPANFLLLHPYPDSRFFVKDGFVPQRIQIKVADFGCAQRVQEVRALPLPCGLCWYVCRGPLMHTNPSCAWCICICIFKHQISGCVCSNASSVRTAKVRLAAGCGGSNGTVPSFPAVTTLYSFHAGFIVLQGQKLHKRTGTPLYMAPELFMQYYGLESDMWALGILLYQMLSGELPFWEPGADRSPWAIMTGILNGEVRPLFPDLIL